MVDLFTWEISKRKKKMYTSTKRLILHSHFGLLYPVLWLQELLKSLFLWQNVIEWADFKKPPTEMFFRAQLVTILRDSRCSPTPKVHPLLLISLDKKKQKAFWHCFGGRGREEYQNVKTFPFDSTLVSAVMKLKLRWCIFRQMSPWTETILRCSQQLTMSKSSDRHLHSWDTWANHNFWCWKSLYIQRLFLATTCLIL